MVTWPIVPRRSANGMSLLMLFQALTFARRDLVRALERGPLVVVRHAIRPRHQLPYGILATVRAPKSMWV